MVRCQLSVVVGHLTEVGAAVLTMLEFERWAGRGGQDDGATSKKRIKGENRRKKDVKCKNEARKLLKTKDNGQKTNPERSINEATLDSPPGGVAMG